jgi:hypothetical protein
METIAQVRSNHPLDNVIEDTSSPLSRLNDFYPDFTTALQDYGRAMQRRHTASDPGECEVCQTLPADRKEAYVWQTMVNPEFTFTKLDFLKLFLGRVGFTIQQTVINFQTAHCVCRRCSSRARKSRGLSVLVKSVSFFLLIICLGAAIIGGGGVLYSLKQTQTFETGFAGLFGFGVVGLAAAYLGHKWESQLRVPTAFRSIGRYPFWLAKVQTLPVGS